MENAVSSAMQSLFHLFLLFYALVLFGGCRPEESEHVVPIPRVAVLDGLDTAALAELDVQYPSAVVQDIMRSAFRTEADLDRLGEAWSTFFQELRRHLESHHVVFKNETDFFFELYCDSSGTIDHLLYSVEGGFNDTLRANFEKETVSFLHSHRLNARASRAYSQCGSILFPPSQHP